jgi:hypothetical protein
LKKVNVRVELELELELDDPIDVNDALATIKVVPNCDYFDIKSQKVTNYVAEHNA